MGSFGNKITAAFVLASLISGEARAESSAQPPAPPPPPASVSAPLTRTVTDYEEFTGRFSASASVQVRARTGGYVEEVRFKDGQEVRKGDVLFVLDKRPFALARDRARAALDLAQKEHERLTGLRRSGAVSAQEIDGATERLRAAEADVKDAELRIEFTEVRAPMDGRAGRRLVDPGTLISGGDASATPLVSVTASDPVYFYFDMGEREWLAYQQRCGAAKLCAEPVRVKLQNEKDYTREGVIDFTDNVMDRDTGAMILRATFANTDRALTPGLFGRLRVQANAPYTAMTVPDEATGVNQSQRFVYTLDAEGTVQMRPVVIGSVHDGMRVIISGLSPQDRVVMENVMKVRPGMKVTPQPYTPPPAAAPAEADKPAPAEVKASEASSAPAEVKPAPAPAAPAATDSAAGK